MYQHRVQASAAAALWAVQPPSQPASPPPPAWPGDSVLRLAPSSHTALSPPSPV